MARLSTDVIDIGRKSERLGGEDIFRTGLMDASFHCCGITPSDTETLNKCVNGLQCRTVERQVAETRMVADLDL